MFTSISGASKDGLIANVAQIVNTEIPAHSPFRTSFVRSLTASIDPQDAAKMLIYDVSTVHKARKSKAPPLKAAFVNPVSLHFASSNSDGL